MQCALVYARACMYVCMYVCMHLCMYVSVCMLMCLLAMKWGEEMSSSIFSAELKIVFQVVKTQDDSDDLKLSLPILTVRSMILYGD